MELTTPDLLIKDNMKAGSATYGAISEKGGPGKKLGAKE